MRRPSVNNKKIILGVTGSFGSGKSSVAKIFASLGAEIIDADKIAHKLIAPGAKGYKKIVSVFGKSVLTENLRIDRKKLADKVFKDKFLLGALNKIVHPQVIRIIKARIKASPKSMIVLDAPLLMEAGLCCLVDKTIVVKASQKKQISRISEKMSISKTDILRRIKSQIPLSDKVRLADFVIDNNGSIDETRKQIEVVRHKILAD